MRLLLAVACVAVLTAGCVAEPEPNPNPLFGFCPSWTEGPGQQAASFHLDGNTTRAGQDFAPTDLHLRGRPFDLLRLRIDAMQVTGGALHVGASIKVNGTVRDLNVRDFRPVGAPQNLPDVQFVPGANDQDEFFDVYLTSVAADEPPQPSAVTLNWTLKGGGSATVAFTATFHYKVCGAALGGPSETS